MTILYLTFAKLDCEDTFPVPQEIWGREPGIRMSPLTPVTIHSLPHSDRRAMGIRDKLYEPFVTSVQEPVARIGVVALASLFIGCISLILVLGIIAEMGKPNASN